MPSESGLPITLGFVMTVFFIMLLSSHYVIAGIFLGIAGLVLAAWHAREPEEA
jgi:phosphatidylserine synthase